MGNTVAQFAHQIKGVGLSANQLTVVSHVRLSLITCVAWCFLGYNYLPLTLPAMPSVAERLAYTIQWQLLGVSFLYLTTMEVSSMRYLTNAIQPLVASEEPTRFQIQKNILSNTVEQVLLNSSSQLILTTLLSEQEMRIIPLLSTLFLFGRIAFYIGYRPDNQMGRSFGFAASLMPTMGMLALSWFRFVPQTLLSLFH